SGRCGAAAAGVAPSRAAAITTAALPALLRMMRIVVRIGIFDRVEQDVDRIDIDRVERLGDRARPWKQEEKGREFHCRLRRLRLVACCHRARRSGSQQRCKKHRLDTHGAPHRIEAVTPFAPFGDPGSGGLRYGNVWAKSAAESDVPSVYGSCPSGA